MAGVEDSVLRLGDEFSRLSTSPLWEVMKSYYAQQGLRSWREEIVPSYITCNVVVAKTVVQLVVAMCDEADARRGRAGPETRVTVLEFGAGSANLMFWVWLLAAEHGVLGPRMRRRKLRFVASDCSSSIIDELLEMPVWAAATKSDKGVDLAVVDALSWSGEPVRTQRHGWTVGGAGEAVCGLCGYVFDTLPHDAFAFSGGAVNRRAHGDPADAAGPAAPGQPAPLAAAKGRVDCAPPSGLAACIVLDKGFSEPHSFVGLGPPELALHGSFSLMVNFHACELAAAALGGCWATAGCDGDDIRLAACVLPPATERRAAPRSFRSPMKEAYPRIYEAINSAPCGGPDAFFHLSCALPDAHDVDRFKRKPTMPLTSILALCQISDWDSDVFARSRAWIAQLLPTAREEHLQMLRDGMARMISMEYPLCVHKDVPFEAARMFQAMGWFGRASELFRVSIARHGEVASSALNLGLCLAARGEHAEAALWLDKAGALEPATNGKRLAESCRAKLRAEAAAAAAQTATEVTLGSRTVLLGLPE